MTALDSEPLLYTAEEASVRLRGAVSAAWLKRAAGNGSVTCTRLGRSAWFSAADLLDIIAEHQRTAANFGRKAKSR